MRQKLIVPIMIVAILLYAGISSALEKSQSGTLHISFSTLALGVGYSWGDGTLRLNDGRSFPFSVEGLKLLGLGLSSVNATGSVYNMKRVSDFNGIYKATDPNVTIIKSRSRTTFRNQRNDVIITLESSNKGADLSIGTKGFEIMFR